MINSLVQNSLRFILLVLIQVLILNNIQLSGYLNPFLYVLILLMLPFETADWVVMLLAFMLGLLLDMFSDTLGLHTSACVFLAYARKSVLRYMAPREGYESGKKPNFRDMGISWFFIYAGILVFAHHLVLFYLETFRLNDFFSTFFKVILSSAFTLLTIFIAQLLFVTPRER
ncbi:MAG: rod shape-determining protein MreD [Bacteroidota bacterium]